MKKKLGFKSIQGKILLGFCVLIILTAIMSTYIHFSTKNINKDTKDIVKEQIPLMSLAAQYTSKMYQIDSLVREYFLYDDETVKGEVEQSKAELQEIEAQLIEKNNEKGVKQLAKIRENWEAVIDGALLEFGKGNMNNALGTLTKAEEISNSLQKGFAGMTAHREQLISDKGDEIISQGLRNLIIAMVIAHIVCLGGIAIAIVTARSISKPIKTVMKRMNDIANGDLNNEPLVTNKKDEIAQLVVATNRMTDNNRELIKEISHVSDSVSSQSEELTQSASEVREGTEQVARTMEELAQGSETQANSASNLAEMMNTFNQSVEEANNSGKQIEENSQHVLDMTAKGSQLMDTSTKQMEKIDSIVKDAVQKMEVLDKQSQEISKLVAVIRDVADQTNLLALNAAIEAARAGEQGKGFAVVADEVRKLAEQVSLSVDDITQFVTNIQTESSVVADSLGEGYKEVEQGSQQLLTTSETFQEIQEAVTEMVKNIDQVSDRLSAITAGSQEMNGSIEEIASVSEEAAAGVEETAASAEQASSSMDEIAGSSAQLAKLAENLNELVGRFKI
ncbi:methyl-accepting chemotaxis protein [Paracerasibacillus soli]|uniref:Methyl-accepting chemotaxis protein n=1 Tax=Paracerasibacillus soli TaxID=480284 RepID=A0ABU5CV13_9BACI|nr:methyl-accepting chemotaxis protein [Virgibacillus soli]MDY0410161.1 methyl-accepting chemotaxis protein [Virgibacillus soli]